MDTKFQLRYIYEDNNNETENFLTYQDAIERLISCIATELHAASAYQGLSTKQIELIDAETLIVLYKFENVSI